MYKQEKRNGKVQYFESYYDHDKGKYRTVSITMPDGSRKSHKLAYDILQDRIKAKVTTTDLRLSDLTDAYCRYIKGELRSGTVSSMISVAQSMIEVLGNPLLDDLTAGYVSNRLDRWDKSPSYKNNKLVRWKTILKWGYRRDYIRDISWIEKLERYKEPQKETEDKYLEPAELMCFLNNLDPRYEQLGRLLALSGLRIGEALALTAKDIDMKEKVIHVTKTRSEHGVGATKTESSKRDVYMQPELYDLCKSLKKGVPYVFPFEYATVRSAFVRAGKKIGKKVTPHILRHTHASMLFAKGFTMDEVAHRLGHSNSAITREIYVHLMEERKKTEKDHLDQFAIGI